MTLSIWQKTIPFMYMPEVICCYLALGGGKGRCSFWFPRKKIPSVKLTALGVSLYWRFEEFLLCTKVNHSSIVLLATGFMGDFTESWLLSSSVRY